MKNELGEFDTVQDLIDHLVELGPERILIVDVDGNTFCASEFDFTLWNPIDPDGPVAIYADRLSKIRIR